MLALPARNDVEMGGVYLYPVPVVPVSNNNQTAITTKPSPNSSNPAGIVDAAVLRTKFTLGLSQGCGVVPENRRGKHRPARKQRCPSAGSKETQENRCNA